MGTVAASLTNVRASSSWSVWGADYAILMRNVFACGGAHRSGGGDPLCASRAQWSGVGGVAPVLGTAHVASATAVTAIDAHAAEKRTDAVFAGTWRGAHDAGKQRGAHDEGMRTGASGVETPRGESVVER